MTVALTPGRIAILKALAKGRRVSGRLASPDGMFKASAFVGRKTVLVRDIDALIKADLIEHQFEGLGAWTGVLTDAGRAALKQAEGERE